MSTTTVKATGLTCNHCAMSVSEEVSEVPGVTGVTGGGGKGGGGKDRVQGRLLCRAKELHTIFHDFVIKQN